MPERKTTPEPQGPLLLGIEGGATHTGVLLADMEGRELLAFSDAAANQRLMSDRELTDHFRSIAAKVETVAPDIAALGIGLAGTRKDEHRERIRRLAARVWPRVPCVATNDLETALAAEPPARGAVARVLILSGTGSCCFGRASDGRTAKSGGRGHIIGDRGSACDIGQRGLRALMSSYDHTGRWPLLGAAILDTLALNEPEDLDSWAIEAGKKEIASAAVAVFHAAAKGDRIAAGILKDAAGALVEDGLTCARRLAKTGQCVHFIFNGSTLLKNPAFAGMVKKGLRAGCPGAVVTPLSRSSVWGAVELARTLVSQSPAPPARRLNKPVRKKKEMMSGPGLEQLASSPTERRNPRSRHLDTMPLPDAVELMLSEEAGVPEALLAERKGIVWTVERIIRAFRRGGRLFYVGAGTSGRLGVLDASECPPTFRVPREQVQGIIAGGQQALWSAVEGAEDDMRAGASAIRYRQVGRNDVVIGIAASGRTPFVWGALAEAKEDGASTVLVTFNPGVRDLRTKVADCIIAPNAGPEILTGSTRLKCGTATKLLLNIFTTLAMSRTGKVISNLMVDLNPSNVKLRDRAVRIVSELTGASAEDSRAALEEQEWVVKDAARSLSPVPSRHRRKRSVSKAT
jgi:N-acetylmuramic acid 6-phosphate etherase